MSEEKKNMECGYCGVTLIAITIAIFSAGITLIIASYMYHGVHDHLEMPNEIMSSSLKRLLVSHKKVIIIRVDAKNRCYILPVSASKDLQTSKFSFLNAPLSRETLANVAGQDGVDFCSTVPAFILEKS